MSDVKYGLKSVARISEMLFLSKTKISCKIDRHSGSMEITVQSPLESWSEFIYDVICYAFSHPPLAYSVSLKVPKV